MKTMTGRTGRLLLLLAGMLAPTLASAQFEANLENYTGENAKGYLMPFKDASGAALNDGTFRTADIPKRGLQFNFEIKAMFVDLADEDRTFKAKTPDGFFPLDGTEVTAPTVVGDTSAEPVSGLGNAEWIPPGGFDMSSVGLAVPQITVGSLMGTQAVVRWIVADTGEEDIGDVDLMGFGVRHSISQYMTDFPVDCAAGLFYQNFKVGDDLIDATAWTFGVQASKRILPIRELLVLEPYGGFSYDTYEMTAEYDSGTGDNPVHVAVDFGTSSTAHFTAGLGLTLVRFVHLQGEVNFASQTSYLLGLSLGN